MVNGDVIASTIRTPETTYRSRRSGLRAVALGRKNYLFAGSDSGGERAAAMYSLIGSAKLNGVEPEAYLSHLLGRSETIPKPEKTLLSGRKGDLCILLELFWSQFF